MEGNIPHQSRTLPKLRSSQNVHHARQKAIDPGIVCVGMCKLGQHAAETSLELYSQQNSLTKSLTGNNRQQHYNPAFTNTLNHADADSPRIDGATGAMNTLNFSPLLDSAIELHKKAAASDRHSIWITWIFVTTARKFFLNNTSINSEWWIKLVYRWAEWRERFWGWRRRSSAERRWTPGGRRCRVRSSRRHQEADRSRSWWARTAWRTAERCSLRRTCSGAWGEAWRWRERSRVPRLRYCSIHKQATTYQGTSWIRPECIRILGGGGIAETLKRLNDL